MTLQWASADLLTGEVLASLPGISVDSGTTLNRTISNVESVQVTLNLDEKTPENWQRAVDPLGAALFVYDDTDSTQFPQWVGYVNSNDAAAETDAVPLGLSTAEGLFDKAYVGDATYDTTWHRDDIIADLFTTWWMPSTGMTVVLKYTPGNGPMPTTDLVVNNTDMSTVKEVLDNVTGQLGGEYTVEWGWNGDTLQATVVFGDRVGTASTGAAPLVTFEMPGSLISFTQTTDRSTGAYANKVTAFSSGEGDSTPDSTVVVAATEGRIGVEYRYSPQQSVSPDALGQYANQAMSVLQHGSQPITMTYSTERDQGRRLGVDWFLGDDLGYRIPAAYTNEQGVTVPIRAFPNGAKGVSRSLGVQVDPNASTITPVTADLSVYTGEVVPV